MKPKKIVVEHIHLTSTEEAVEPPPPRLRPKFESLVAWLDNICDSGQPKLPIATYSFGVFFEKRGEFVLTLVGYNENNNHRKIDFEPPEMYYKVVKSEASNLAYEQYVNLLKKQLEIFFTTGKFERSYLSRARSIELDGQMIWPKH
jgi:hypothetical protein